MDEFLNLVGVQAMRYAIRSSIALASTYAVGRLSQFAKSADDHKLYSEFKTLHSCFETKIKIISPAIDLINLKSGRGNVFLESAAPMTKALQQDIASLVTRIEQTLLPLEASTSHVPELARQAAMNDIKIITTDLHQLLARIDREVPLLQLAISASGESLSTGLPPSVSPSRLLQASTLLVVSDIQFSRDPLQTVQIGPTFYLSLYMLFRGHAPPCPSVRGSKPPNHDVSDQKFSYGMGPTDRKPIWQEVMHKTRVRLLRKASPGGNLGDGIQAKVYRYVIDIAEDQSDGRVHDNFNDDSQCGCGHQLDRRDDLPVQEVSKLFYTDAGRILNLGHENFAENSPVLLLKRDISPLMDTIHRDHACSQNVRGQADQTEQVDVDQQLLKELQNAGYPRNPPSSVFRSILGAESQLDPEWIAFEVFEDDETTFEDSGNSDFELEEEDGYNGSSQSTTSLDQIASIEIDKAGLETSAQSCTNNIGDGETPSDSPLGAIISSLSLLEMLIRLASLQEFQQTSHLSIPDHILTFFLEETSSTGLVGDSQMRAKMEAKTKVGFDPYTDKVE